MIGSPAGDDPGSGDRGPHAGGKRCGGASGMDGTFMTMRAGEVYEHPGERLVVRVGTAVSGGEQLI